MTPPSATSRSTVRPYRGGRLPGGAPPGAASALRGWFARGACSWAPGSCCPTSGWSPARRWCATSAWASGKADAIGGAMHDRLRARPVRPRGPASPDLRRLRAFPAAVLWRGVGLGCAERTLFRWEAPDGTRLLTVYLMLRLRQWTVHLPLETATRWLPGCALRELATPGGAPSRACPDGARHGTAGDHDEPRPKRCPRALEQCGRRTSVSP